MGLALLAGWGLVCGAEDGKYLFKNRITSPRLPSDEALKELLSDRKSLTLDETYERLGSLEKNAGLGKTRAYEYAKLGYINLSNCEQSKMKARERVCKSAPSANLKRYCEYCGDEQVRFCKENSGKVMQTYIGRRQDQISSIIDRVNEFMRAYDTMIHEHDWEVRDFELNIRSACKALKEDARKKLLQDCHSLTGLLHELDWLILRSHPVIAQINLARKKPIDRQVKLCFGVTSWCRPSFNWF